MKHLHIVEPYHSTAMLRMNQPLLDWLPKLYTVTTGEEIDPEADLNLHIPWHTLAGKEKGNSRHIIAYTHTNPGAVPALLDACGKADLIMAMSFEGRRELIGYGVDPKKIWVNYCAANGFSYRRRIIAVAGYPQPNGRKREHLLLDMAWQYDLSMYEFLFVGDGWQNLANEMASLGVAVQAFHADNIEALATIYQRIDVLLVTGYVEGGPLPLLEAMASGTKVFSPRFGYAADLLEEEDLYDDLPDLMDALEEYFKPSVRNCLLARAWTWQDFTAEYALLVGRLLGESVDLFPERGMSRYAQLLDVIDEIKPASLVEIGVWNGHTASRMIQQAAKHKPIEDIYYQGFDLFEMQTTADYYRELSKSGWPEHIVERKLDATGAEIKLVKGYTKDTLNTNIGLQVGLCFVDGGHSEETIKHDAATVLDAMNYSLDMVAIFDDYYHEGQPEGMGCNKFIDNLDREEYEVTFLPALTKSEDGRVIGMVKVRRRHANIYLPMREQARIPATTSGDGVYTTTTLPEMWKTITQSPSIGSR